MRVKRLFAFLGSYGLSVVLLLFLSLLTLLGTFEQVDHGLYAVQKKYFASLFLVHHVFDRIPVPLPGVYLLTVLLFVNLLCGAVIRARKGWRHAGILVAHLGILLLLAGSFVTFQFALRGHVTLYEGEEAGECVSYDVWEVAVTSVGQADSASQYLIPETRFTSLKSGEATTFHADALPFDVTLSGYALNARPQPAAASGGAHERVVDGFRLVALASEPDAARNSPGVYATVRARDSGTVQEGILWAQARSPWTVTVEDQAWSLDLRTRTWPLGFTIRLDTFIRELYPGTTIPKAFVSEVTRIDGADRQQARISMNEPLRYKKYIFYQSSWGPPNAGPNDRLYSSLAVVRNPADQFPLYACCVICFGLVVHFCQKLVRYLRAESKRRS